MKIHASKSDLQSIVNASFTALIHKGFKAKRSVLQDRIAELLTEGQRKYSSLMSDYPLKLKTFDFNGYDGNHPRGFDEIGYTEIQPILEQYQHYSHPLVCVRGDMRPQRILEDKGGYRLSEFIGSYNEKDLGVYFERTDDFTGITHEFAIFDFEIDDIEGIPCVTFMLQTGQYEDVVQIKDCVEWFSSECEIERTDSNLKINMNLYPAFENKLKDLAQPADDIIPYGLIFDALQELVERPAPLVIEKTPEAQIPTAIKIETAKAFAACHKQKIFDLVAYEDGESVPDSVWMNIWEYIWDHLESQNGEDPYIELKAHETVSGHTEIFNVNYAEILFLFECEKTGIASWTPQGLLKAFDLDGGELFKHPESGDIQTSQEWAKKFTSVREDGLPALFFAMAEEEIDFDSAFDGHEIAGQIRIWPESNELVDESFECSVTTDEMDSLDNANEADELLKDAFAEGLAWINSKLERLSFLTPDQKTEILDNFKNKLSFYLHNSRVGQMTTPGFDLLGEQEQ